MGVLELMFVGLMEPFLAASMRLAEALIVLYLTFVFALAAIEMFRLFNGEREFNFMRYVRPALYTLLIVATLKNWGYITESIVYLISDSSKAFARGSVERIPTPFGVDFMVPTTKDVQWTSTQDPAKLSAMIGESVVRTVIVDTGNIMGYSGSVFELKTKAFALQMITGNQYDYTKIIEELKKTNHNNYSSLPEFIKKADEIISNDLAKAMSTWNVFKVIANAILYIASTLIGWVYLAIFTIVGFIVFVVAIRYIFINTLSLALAILIAPLAVAFSPISKEYLKKAFTMMVSTILQFAVSVAAVPLFVGALMFITLMSIFYPSITAIHVIVAALMVMGMAITIIPKLTATVELVIGTGFAGAQDAMGNALKMLRGAIASMASGISSGYRAVQQGQASSLPPTGAKVPTPAPLPSKDKTGNVPPKNPSPQPPSNPPKPDNKDQDRNGGDKAGPGIVVSPIPPVPPSPPKSPSSRNSPNGTPGKKEENGRPNLDTKLEAKPNKGSTNGGSATQENELKDKQAPTTNGRLETPNGSSAQARIFDLLRDQYQKNGNVITKPAGVPVPPADLLDFKNNGYKPVVVLEYDESGKITNSYTITPDLMVHYSNGRTEHYFEKLNREYDDYVRQHQDEILDFIADHHEEIKKPVQINLNNDKPVENTSLQEEEPSVDFVHDEGPSPPSEGRPRTAPPRARKGKQRTRDMSLPRDDNNSSSNPLNDLPPSPDERS